MYNQREEGISALSWGD